MGTYFEPELSGEQMAVIEHVKDGHSLFFTGCAGTGKVMTPAQCDNIFVQSYLLRRIIEIAPMSCTFVTATTGAAAVNIGGITLHSFAGIGVDCEDADVMADHIMNSKKQRYVEARQHWKSVHTLLGCWYK